MQDAFFSPTTQTPYTDDLQIGYGVDLGNNMSFDAQYYNRRSRDILEDYDPSSTRTRTATPDRSTIRTRCSSATSISATPRTRGSNFVIGTLAGGKRDFNGLEFVFRKRFANHWQLLVVVQLAGRQGQHQLRLERRLPGRRDLSRSARAEQFGTQPGLIRHLAKGGGVVHVRLRPAAGRHVLAGTRARSPAARSSRRSRNLPIRVSAAEAFSFAGYTNRWLAPDAVGSLENPAWGKVDLRAQYNRRITSDVNAEFFVDLFNVINNQSSIRNQDLVAGSGGNAFGSEILWVEPRRAFLGARVKF